MTDSHISVKYKLLPHGVPNCVPEYKSEGAAGMDLRAAIDKLVLVFPHSRQIIPTGVVLEIPEGYEGQVRGRSGLAYNHGLAVLHGVGTIDSDYRGEISVPLFNHGGVAYGVKPNERIAQIVIAPVARAVLIATDELSETERGDGGGGSTGRF